MTPELENKLYEKYPLLFANRHLPATQTCMCWGFEHGDGWYQIVDNLCQSIQEYININNVPQVTVDQVKEKYGTLRFYYSGGDEEIDKLVATAESLSAKTCEICGDVGSITTTRTGWYSTLCEKHCDPKTAQKTKDDDQP